MAGSCFTKFNLRSSFDSPTFAGGAASGGLPLALHKCLMYKEIYKGNKRRRPMQKEINDNSLNAPYYCHWPHPSSDWSKFKRCPACSLLSYQLSQLLLLLLLLALLKLTPAQYACHLIRSGAYQWLLKLLIGYCSYCLARRICWLSMGSLTSFP